MVLMHDGVQTMTHVFFDRKALGNRVFYFVESVSLLQLLSTISKHPACVVYTLMGFMQCYLPLQYKDRWMGKQSDN